MTSPSESPDTTSVLPSLESPMVISHFSLGTSSVVERGVLGLLHPDRIIPVGRLLMVPERLIPVPIIVPLPPTKLLPEPESSPVPCVLLLTSPERLLSEPVNQRGRFSFASRLNIVGSFALLI